MIPSEAVIAAKFRKKPVIIEAVQFKDFDDYLTILQWMKESGPAGAKAQYDAPVVLVHTLEGVMAASPGDWVIRGVKGEFYPCKPDIFSATYEDVGPVQ